MKNGLDEIKTSMKTDFEGMKKEVKEDLKKFTGSELKKSLKAMKNDFEGLKNFTENELKTSLKTTKNDFEDLKKEVKEDLKKLTFDRDQYLKKIKLLEKENSRLRENKPKELNEESFHEF